MEAEYKIIGGDGVEYGPATLDELRGWIRDGRVAGMTPVWRNDMAAWSPAGRYSELSDDLSRLHAVAEAARPRPCGFWVRLAAHVIDILVLGTIFQLAWTPLANARHWILPEVHLGMTDAVARQFMAEWAPRIMPLYYSIFFLYELILNGRFGATVGKMAAGVRIVRLDGAPIGYGRAALRWLAERVSDMFCFAGYFFIAARPDKRALHDLMAGTKVIYKR